MEILFIMFLIAVFFVSWVMWGIIACVVFSLAILIPWGLLELFMYYTFNNIMNAVSKIPTVFGWIIGFLFALPFSIPGIVLSTWCYFQIAFMGELVIKGDPTSSYVHKFPNNLAFFEGGYDGSMIIARFFYDHCQWLWGSSSIFKGLYPWQNGVWCAAGDPLSPPISVIKIFVLCIPYSLMFILPLIPVIWSLFRPIVAACSKLPAVTDNGNGRD